MTLQRRSVVMDAHLSTPFIGMFKHIKLQKRLLTPWTGVVDTFVTKNVIAQLVGRTHDLRIDRTLFAYIQVVNQQLYSGDLNACDLFYCQVSRKRMLSEVSKFLQPRLLLVPTENMWYVVFQDWSKRLRLPTRVRIVDISVFFRATVSSK